MCHAAAATIAAEIINFIAVYRHQDRDGFPKFSPQQSYKASPTTELPNLCVRRGYGHKIGFLTAEFTWVFPVNS